MLKRDPTPKKTLEEEIREQKAVKLMLEKQMAELQKLLNKRMEFTVDRRCETVSSLGRRILGRFRDRQITF